MNKRGTIIGPEGTETIVCMNDLAMTGYKVEWTVDGLEIAKEGRKRPIEIRNGQPILPNEMCLALIEEIEEAKVKKSDQ